MTAAPGSWLDDVDYSVDFPGEPLVPIGVIRKSPYHAARESIPNLMDCVAFLDEHRLEYPPEAVWYQVYVDGQWINVNETVLAEHPEYKTVPEWRWQKKSDRNRLEWVFSQLLRVEGHLVADGPELAAMDWARIIGKDLIEQVPMGRLSVRMRESGNGFDRSSTGEWRTVCVLPSMQGLTPVSAALYLSLTGQVSKPVPISFARATLSPEWKFPSCLNELSTQKTEAELHLPTLGVDEKRRLVITEKSKHRRYHSSGHETERPLDTNHVLADGWMRRGGVIFHGCPAITSAAIQHGETPSMPLAEYEHDGDRLIRLAPPDARSLIRAKSEPPQPNLPVVELSEIVSEINAVLTQVSANPEEVLDYENPDRIWRGEKPKMRLATSRIVEAALREFTPWPHPFKLRTEKQMRLRPHESRAEVEALFDRILDAPGPIKPSDLTAYFFSLITKRRAEFSAWPEEFVGVWGFKIKTGDHNWIEGKIWRWPDEDDEPDEPVDCDEYRIPLEANRYRKRYREITRVFAGNVCCYIERDDK